MEDVIFKYFLIFRFPFCTELVNKLKYRRTPPTERILVEAEGFVKFSLAVADTAQKILRRIKKRRRQL
jgi:polyphosphate kinase 2 (PPK2 family)